MLRMRCAVVVLVVLQSVCPLPDVIKLGETLSELPSTSQSKVLSPQSSVLGTQSQSSVQSVTSQVETEIFWQLAGRHAGDDQSDF